MNFESSPWGGGATPQILGRQLPPPPKGPLANG